MKMPIILAFCLMASGVFWAEAANAAEQRGDTRFLLLIAEQPLPGAKTVEWWRGSHNGLMGIAGQAIARELKEKNLLTISPESAPLLEADLQRPVTELSPDMLKRIGDRLQADFIVVGTAETALQGPIPGGSAMQIEAHITLKVLAIETGKWIASGDRRAVAAYPVFEEAGRLALYAAGSALGRQLAGALDLHPDVRMLIQRRTKARPR